MVSDKILSPSEDPSLMSPATAVAAGLVYTSLIQKRAKEIQDKLKNTPFQ